MKQTKGFTVKDFNYINSTCRSIARCERYGLSDKELRQQIYMLGLYAFRQFHKAGLPADYRHPGLNDPVKQYGYLTKSQGIHNISKHSRTGSTLR